MNNDIVEMINIYNTFDIDWLGDKINYPSDLTRHHIVKKEHNGEDSINNYALLTSLSHHFIHYLEIKYNKEYNELNNLLLELNKSGKPPTDEYFDKVMKIAKRVKKDIKNKKRNRK